jgi:hypothetical protein
MPRDEAVAAIMQEMREKCEDAGARAREQSDGLHDRPVEEALDQAGGFAGWMLLRIARLRRELKRVGVL